MEMSHRNPLYSYLKQTKMSFFLFYKIREQEGRTGPVWGVGTSRRGQCVEERVWEDEYSANTVHTNM
jgi:hypothetical protein